MVVKAEMRNYMGNIYNRNIYTMVRRICIFICAMAIMTGCALLVTSCGEKKNDKSAFKIYYLNKDESKLVSTGYKLIGRTQDEQVEEVLNKLSGIPSKINYVNAIPENVKLESYTIDDNNNISISFSTEYLNMDKVRDVMCRAAYVFSLTQIEGIEYVTFYIENEPLKNSDDSQVGMMKATDFVNSSGSSINMYENISMMLYFGNEVGDKLVEKSYEKVYSKNVSLEKYILEQLIKGPSEEGVLRTIPADTKIVSVLTKDGICYVSLDENFLDENTDVSAEVEIYSIVNSLCELTTVNKVQISINGDTDKKLHKSISLDQIFTRNLDIVEKDKE